MTLAILATRNLPHSYVRTMNPETRPSQKSPATLSELGFPAAAMAVRPPIPSLIPAHSTHCHFLGSLTISAAKGQSLSPLSHTLSKLSAWFGKEFPRSVRVILTPEKLQEGGALTWGESHLSVVRYAPVGVDGERPTVLACALEHTDSRNAGRRWRTEIILKELPNRDVSAYVGVHHGVRSGYFGPAPETPSPSTPTVVRRLIEDPRLDCYYDVLKSFDSPLKVDDTTAHGELFAKLLTHSGRKTPVVFMNRRSDLPENEFAWDPFSMTRGCFGSGTVVVPTSSLRRDGPFLTALAWSLGEQGALYVSGLANGGVRVFQPKLDPDVFGDSKRHRYFHHSSGPEVPLWIQAGLRSTLRARLDQQGEVASFEGVLDAIRKDEDASRWEELRARVREAISPDVAVAAEQERENLRNLVMTLQEEVQSLRGNARDLAALRLKVDQVSADLQAAEELLDASNQRGDDLEEAFEEARTARFTAEQETQVYRQLLEGKNDADVARKKLLIPQTLPSNPHEAVSFLQNALSPRVVLLDNAVASSHQIPPSRLYETWESLVQLHEVLWPLHFGEAEGETQDKRVQTIPAKFSALTGIEYTINESSMTNKDSALMRQRRAIIDDKEFDFSAHLKIGTKERDAVRIHIAVDDASRRILVWHCGTHLDTAGTRRI